MFENHAKKLTAALFAAGLLGAASSWAQAPAGAEGMGPMPGFDRLHKELKLNAQQEDLWKRAQAAQREAFVENLGAFVDQGVDGALDDFVVRDGAAFDAIVLRYFFDQRGDFRIGRRLTIGVVGIVALARLLTEAAKFASWIAPPKVGIDNKPGDFEYVKIET